MLILDAQCASLQYVLLKFNFNMQGRPSAIHKINMQRRPSAAPFQIPDKKSLSKTLIYQRRSSRSGIEILYRLHKGVDVFPFCKGRDVAA